MHRTDPAGEQPCSACCGSGAMGLSSPARAQRRWPGWSCQATAKTGPDVLSSPAYDLWHDRAVFHVLVEPADRQGCVSQLQRSLRPGGLFILATFAEDGPQRCSGLPVQRPSVDCLRQALADGLELRSAARQPPHPWRCRTDVPLHRLAVQTPVGLDGSDRRLSRLTQPLQDAAVAGGGRGRPRPIARTASTSEGSLRRGSRQPTRLLTLQLLETIRFAEFPRPPDADAFSSAC
jgi:hypothetical protein